LAENHKFSLKGVYSRNDEEEARHEIGTDDEQGEVEETRLRFVRREIFSMQLTGEHHLPGFFGSTFNWRASSADATRDEPLNRSNYYLLSYDDQGQIESRRWNPNGYSGAAIFTALDDNDATGAIDWTLPLWNGAKLKTGGLFQSKTRQFQAQRYRFNSTGGQTPRGDYAEMIFTPENIGPVKQNQFKLESGTSADDHYNVDEHIAASFAMAEIPVTSRIRLIGGCVTKISIWSSGPAIVPM